jgi:hypothetical protein
MLRRICYLLSIVAIAAVVLLPSAAFAWSNGGEDSLNDVHWGTHDWVMWQAYVQAGSPAWFDIDEALLNNDDPDADVSRMDHVYHPKDGIGGAPYQVGEHYSEAVRDYQAGDYAAASRAMGLLSHYYSDVCQPLHTVPRGAAGALYDRIHSPYELEVRPLAYLKRQLGMLKARDRRSIADTNVRALTIAAAKVAKGQLSDLAGGYEHGGLDNSSVKAATKVCLSQAVNGLADMIAAVPSGQGQAAAAVSFAAFHAYRHYTARNGHARADARVVNAAGKPVRAVKVTFTWQFASGTRDDIRYTDSDGYAHSVQMTGTQAYFTKFHVTAHTVGAGLTLTSPSTWFVTTPILKSSSAGFVSSVSSSSPRRGTTVTAKAKAVSTSGKAVAGLVVKFIWMHKSGSIVTYATTGSDGVARSSRNIGQCARGYRVNVQAGTQAGGSNRHWTTGFTPR